MMSYLSLGGKKSQMVILLGLYIFMMSEKGCVALVAITLSHHTRQTQCTSAEQVLLNGCVFGLFSCAIVHFNTCHDSREHTWGGNMVILCVVFALSLLPVSRPKPDTWVYSMFYQCC